MSEVVRFQKLGVGSADWGSGKIWFIADEVSHQIVRLFETKHAATAWLQKNTKEARRLLKQELEFNEKMQEIEKSRP